MDITSNDFRKEKKGEILSQDFFEQEDVVKLAQELLGKFLFTSFDNTVTGGIIIETEAYRGTQDKACHAYKGRRTKRTEVMFHRGGIAYVYLCYGMHHLFNIVTHKEGVPHAILVRGLYPTHGRDQMLKRRQKTKWDTKFIKGPGMLTQALNIHTSHSGMKLQGPLIYLEDRGIKIKKETILVSPRIGVSYAGEDAHLPYRFLLPNNIFFT